MSYQLPKSPSTHENEKELRKRIPRLQTAPTDSKTSLASRVEQMRSPMTNSANTSSSSEQVRSPGSASHQRLVLTDHVAFRYLEDDPSTTVLSRREKLVGYELFVVEQWVCSRTHPTMIITTYTGDPKDIVYCAVLSVPSDESKWSLKMRMYLKALEDSHARRKVTNLGTLMITNLNGFPSSLTIIPIPEGDLKKHREIFFVNENLKRLGCSGRLGIKLAEPSGATRAKFQQLYRVSDKVPLNGAVIELTKLCQAALVMFGVLETAYADGLLCDMTEKAINDWWVEFGAEYYTTEPQDGVLGPTTVAAMMGMLMGARNRLSAYNAPVSKDVFDIESTTKGTLHFQKTQRLQRTGHLDRQTLERLRRVTAKAASKDGWAVPRVFKSTVAELGGKGGEMVMGMVGAGDKAGIADIETVDYDRFVELCYGERAKWLWYGKPRKTNTGDMFSRLPRDERSVSPDSLRTSSSMKREPTLEGDNIAKRDSTDLGKRSELNGLADIFEKEKDLNSKRAVIRRATEKIEAGSGFHRIKDVVGRRNHQAKPPKDEAIRSPLQHVRTDAWIQTGNTAGDAGTSKVDDVRREDSDLTHIKTEPEPIITKMLTQTPQHSMSAIASDRSADLHVTGSSEPPKPETAEDEDSRPPTMDNSIAGSIYRGIDLNAKLPCDETHDLPPLLRRTKSSDQLDPYYQRVRNDNWWPRHLSFSIAEESVLTWRSLIDTSTTSDDLSDPTAALTTQLLLSSATLRLRHRLALVSSLDASWVQAHISAISDMDAAAEADTFQLDGLYYPALDNYEHLRDHAHDVVTGQRAQLQEGVRELLNLSDKLVYEIGGLRGKVDDVEEGVAELERQVEFVEGRLRELQGVIAGGKEGWGWWILRMLTGISRARK